MLSFFVCLYTFFLLDAFWDCKIFSAKKVLNYPNNLIYITTITKRKGTGLRTLVKNYKGTYCILAYGFPLRITGLVSMWYKLFFFIYFDFDIFKFPFLSIFTVFIICKVFLTKLLLTQASSHQVVFDKQPNLSNLK